MSADCDIEVHPDTNNASKAWNQLCKIQKVFKINVSIPDKPTAPKKIRFVCMSDTHSLQKNLTFDVPDGDVFIHAGDFTKCGLKEEVIEFNDWLGTLKHKFKVVICGNHELSFDNRFADEFNDSESDSNLFEDDVRRYNTKEMIKDAVNTENIRQYLTNCIYLEDSSVTLYGIKIYGTPWQPEFGGWAFNISRGEECLAKWRQIPEDTDILVTHTPPVGHGDLACAGVRAGCVELLSTVQRRVKPKYHVFGHIHEGYGVTSDGKIVYINASTCDVNYTPKNLPIVFDITRSDDN